eukprot:SAG31_NODE_2238_length_6119_cov_3.847508_8_plen_94_part_01
MRCAEFKTGTPELSEIIGEVGSPASFWNRLCAGRSRRHGLPAVPSVRPGSPNRQIKDLINIMNMGGWAPPATPWSESGLLLSTRSAWAAAGRSS